MKTRFLLFAATLCCIFLTQKMDAQVTSVNYRLKYNPDSCRYEAYVVINSGTATTTAQKTQFNSQYTIVLPEADRIVDDSITSHAPFIANFGGLTTDPVKWKISTQVRAPAVRPNERYYSITPSIPPTSRYSANLLPGDEILLFSFKVSSISNCGSGIRIWENGSDPDSGQSGMQGSDYNNGFTVGSGAQLYNANSTQVHPPLPVLVGATTTCANGIEIDLTATTSSCQSPLRYSWTTNATSNYTSTTQDVSIVPSTLNDVGTYKVVVTDSLGCKDSLTIAVTNKPNAGSDQTVCAGTTANIQGNDPTTGTWTALGTNPSGATLNLLPAGAANVVFSNSAVGIYSFIYSTPSCSDTMSITVTARPIVSLLGVTTLCIGNTTTLSPNTGGKWVSNNPTRASVDSLTGVVTALAQGSVTFTFTDSITGCSATTSAITINPKPPVAVTGNPAICIGSTTTLSPTTGGTWASVFPAIASVNPTTGLVTGQSAGTGRFVWTESTGCISDTINVTVTPKPTITLTGPASICVFTTTTFTPDSAGTWASTNPTVASISTGGIVTGLSSGTARFIWTQSSTGCTSDTSVIITVVALPTVNVTHAVRCMGDTTTLKANRVGTWASNNLSVATVLDSTVTAVSQGQATFTFTETATGCQNTTSAFTVNPKPTVLVAANPICIGSSTTLTPSSGGSWSQVTGGTGSLTLLGNTITGVTAGTKTVRFTETASGCTNDTSITITPRPVVSITGSNSICSGFTTQLSPSTGGTWVSNNLSVATVLNTGLVTGISVGSATFTFTLTGSCSSDPTAPVVVKNKPAVSISGSNQICVLGTTTLAVTPVTGGTWTSNNTSIATVDPSTGVVTGVAPGNVTFYFTDNTGCISDNTAPVTVNIPPTVSFTGTSVVCAGFTTTLSPTTGGTWASSDTLIAKVNNAGMVTGISVGNVLFTFTQIPSGCVSSALQGRVSAKPIVSFGPSPICIGGTKQVNSDSTGTWISNNNAIATITNNGLITGVSAGTAIFTFTSNDLCSADPIISVPVSPKPTATITGNNNICIGATTALAPTSGGTWSSSDTNIATVTSGGIVTGISSGSVTFTFTTTAGCASDPSAPVTVNARPIIVLNGPDSICVGATTNLSPAINGSWASSNPAVATITNSGLVTGLTPGRVAFTYTLASTQCSSLPSDTVTIVPGPTASLGPDTTLCIGATTTLSPTTGGTWTSSNAAVASITSGGVVTAVSQGSATFRFRLTATGCLSSPTNPITVNASPAVSITGSNTICILGTTTLSPSSGGTWTSSADTIASVNPTTGVVTGLRAGTATFTFTPTGGCPSAPTLPVTVTATTTVTFTGPTNICVGGSTTLSPTTGGVWESSNTTIATIHPNTGVVTSLAPGKVVFRFTATSTGCPSAWSDTLTITHCFNPDFNATFVNVSVPGNLRTNDNVDPASTYGPTPVVVSTPSGSIYTLTVNSNGTYTFIANMEGVYRFEVPVCIPPTVSGCPRSDLTITVRNNISPDPLPIANVDIASTPIGTPVTLRTLSNDRCTQITGCSLNPATVNITDAPSHGSTSINTSTGDITYTPTTPGFVGLDTLTYEVCVTGAVPAICATAKQIITVNAATAGNTTIAADDFAVTPQNTAVSGNVKDNDSDPEGNIQTVTVQNTTETGKGTLVLASDGAYTFTPVNGFSGPVEFIYRTIDNHASPDTAYATLHILVMQDLTINVRVYLEGALLNNSNALASGRPLMRDNLRSSIFVGQTGVRYIPSSDPYKFKYGTVNVVSKFTNVAPGTRTEFNTVLDSATVFGVTGQDAIVDWVFIELRSTTTTVIATRSGLLQRDGDVVDLDGVSGLRFPSIAMGNYYVVVRHHSHLGAMTAAAQTPLQLTTLVNFTSTSTANWDYGTTNPNSVSGGINYTGLAQQNVVKSGITYRALWAGDFDKNRKIKNDNPDDDINILNIGVLTYNPPANGYPYIGSTTPTATQGNTGFTSNFDFGYGYLQGDFDMNGKAKFDNPNDDKNMLYGQLLFYPLNGQLLSNFDHFIEQLP